MEHDFTVTTGQIEREIALDAFPSPEQLWQCYCQWKGIDNPQQAIITQEYYDDSSGKVPRYYQVNAINLTVEAIALGENRILLVMATVKHTQHSRQFHIFTQKSIFIVPV